MQIDGNDVLASYAVTAKHLDDARSGEGPSMIEALTYRIGRAHLERRPQQVPHATTSSTYWAERDPILRFRAFLEQQGVGQAFFDSADEEAADLAADIRRRTLELERPARRVDVRPRLQ